MHIIHFNLPTVAPFRLDLTVWALRRRARNIVDRWDGVCYTRVFTLEHSPVKVEIEQITEKPQISVVAYAHHSWVNLQSQITDLLNTMLGLNLDLTWFYDLTKNDPILHPLVLKYKGLKPPRFPSIFETLTNAIACQQVSLEAALSLLNNLTARYGKPFKERNQVFYAFPEPYDIMRCSEEELKALGFSQRKSETLILIASTIFKKEKTFCDLDRLSNENIIEHSCRLKGIGRWSAEYLLLRGLGRTEILPGDDVGVQKSVQLLLKLRKKSDYHKIKKIEKKWHPYAGLIYFHFLLKKLSEMGVIEDFSS